MEDDEAEPKIGRRVNAQLLDDERLYRRRTRMTARYFDDTMGYEDDN